MKPTRKQKAQLRESCPHSSARVRKMAEDYIAAAGLTVGGFAAEVGYGKTTVSMFLNGTYCQGAGTKDDLAVRAAVYGFMQRYPVNGSDERPLPKQLCPTSDVRIVLERLEDARRGAQYALFEGPPGTSKTVVSRWYEAERNRLGKRDVFRVLAFPEITANELLKLFARKVGAHVSRSIGANLNAVGRALKRKKPCLVVVDEAQFLLGRSDTPFEMLRSLCDRTHTGCALFSHFRFVRALTNGRAADLEQWLSRFDFHYQLRGLKKTDLPEIARQRMELQRLSPGLLALVEEVALVRDRNSAARSRTRPKDAQRLPANYYSFRRLDKFFQRIAYLRTIPVNRKTPLIDLAEAAADLLLSSSGSAL